MNHEPQRFQPKRGPFPITKESRSWEGESKKSTVVATEKEIARFWKKVNLRGPTVARGIGCCWAWKGNTEWRPTFLVGGIGFAAARVVFSLIRGPITTSSLLACHVCDNPRCVRPSHIFLGTHKDNALDRELKGRGSNGKKGSSKPPFTESQRREIQDLKKRIEQIDSMIAPLKKERAEAVQSIKEKKLKPAITAKEAPAPKPADPISKANLKAYTNEN